MVTVSIVCRMCHTPQAVEVRLEDLYRRIQSRSTVQVCFPYLSPAERELFVSATCDGCFKKLFPVEEEDNACDPA